MRDYKVTITGVMPLLVHRDSIEWADQMDRWKNDPDNKKICKAGDDRMPAYRWLGCLYHDGDKLIIPAENIMRAIMEGGAQVLVPGGKSGKTFKSQSQSGIMPRDIGWPLTINSETIPYQPLDDLKDEPDFEVHQQTCKQYGFSLSVKRARVGTAKHIRVRPRFDRWAASGILTVTDPSITEQVLSSILSVAGTFKGIGDWRPSSRTPGSYGTFTAKVQEV